jgi:hypothetical protein
MAFPLNGPRSAQGWLDISELAQSGDRARAGDRAPRQTDDVDSVDETRRDVLLLDVQDEPRPLALMVGQE